MTFYRVIFEAGVIFLSGFLLGYFFKEGQYNKESDLMSKRVRLWHMCGHEAKVKDGVILSNECVTCNGLRRARVFDEKK